MYSFAMRGRGSSPQLPLRKTQVRAPSLWSCHSKTVTSSVSSCDGSAWAAGQEAQGTTLAPTELHAWGEGGGVS